MESHLKQYLTDYLAWAEGGESRTAFDDNVALCGNIAPWVTRNILGAEQWDAWTDIVDDLANELRIDGLNTYYPFGEEVYHTERFNKSHHKNPARLEWIRQTIKSI